MTNISRLKFYNCFLSTMLFCSGSIFITSCSEDSDEPSIENGKEDNDGDNTETNNIPLEFISDYQLGYVVMPENTPEQYKKYTGFILSYNKDNHTPNYVAWELLDSETTGPVNRNDYNYWVDNDLEGCLSIDFAYNTYGYERGHMCPAADQKWSTKAMNDCMVIANMVPQFRELNAGLWETLEMKEREWAKRDKAIWIISGPIYYDTDDLYLGKSYARAPSACFKAFLYNDEEKPRAIAFVMQNGLNPGNLEDYAMSIDDLEKETGYDFFSVLPDEIENKIESSYSFADWNK